MRRRPPDELRAGYEALRATATGCAFAETPRGLALFLAQGLPAWTRAWAPLPQLAPIVRTGERPASSLGTDVVRVLTEMALGCRAGLAAS